MLKTNIQKLAEMTVGIVDCYNKKYPGSIILNNDLTSCDAVIFFFFVILYLRQSKSGLEQGAKDFKKEYTNHFIDFLVSRFDFMTKIEEMFDNRSSFYERVVNKEYDPKNKFRALIEEFELIIKTDLIKRQYCPFSETSPLPLLGIQEDLKVRMEISLILKNLQGFVSPFLDDYKLSLS